MKQISLMNDTFSPRLIWDFRLILQKKITLKKNIMKTKITYLLLILPLLTFAQGPWNFDTSTEGFVAPGHTVTQTGGDLKVEFIANAVNNPIIRKADAGIDADTNINFIEIRLKNLSTVSYLRFCPSLLGSNYGNVQISTADTNYKTYIIDVSVWTGASVGIDILCKKYTGTTAGGAYTPVAGEYILIDYIKPLANLATPEVNVFNFNTAANVEGFTTLTRATAIQATELLIGALKINCTTANANNAKVALSSLVAHVEGSNKYAHITLKNMSTNTLFQLNGKVAGVGTAFNPIQTYTTSDADYKTYDFDLSTWDSGYQFPELNFGVKDTWDSLATYAVNATVINGNSTYKNTTGTNDPLLSPKNDTTNWVIVGTVGDLLDLTNFIYVDSIVFDNTAPALGTADFVYTNNTISLYPNPAKDVLNVSSSNKISKIEVYDFLGRKVASKNNASDVNVSALGKGVYIVKVAQENGSVIAKQFIKE